MTEQPPAVSVIIVGYGVEARLEACVNAAAADLSPEDELILVDNGIKDAHSRRARWPAQMTVVGDGKNRGFAGGCHLAVTRAHGSTYVFLNSDAIMRNGSLRALQQALLDPEVGVAGGRLCLATSPDKINSAGNPLHFLGFSWAGGHGDAAVRHERQKETPVATGGFLGISRDVWTELGGFDPQFFAYHEDTDISLRCWMSGRSVIYVPTAIADHHYDFSRNSDKMYLLERNRLLLVLTDYPRALLLKTLPGLVSIEPLILLLAVRQGWARKKLHSWWWLTRNVGAICARRRRIQSQLRVADAVLLDLMSSRLEPPMVAWPSGLPVLNKVLEVYWKWAANRSAVVSP